MSKPNLQSKPHPTRIPQQREKIAFALNQGIHLKKQSTVQATESETKSESVKASKQESKISVGTNDEGLQINEIVSSAEMCEKEVSGNEKRNESEPLAKGRFYWVIVFILGFFFHNFNLVKCFIILFG